MSDFNALVEAEIERHARQWEKTEGRLHRELEQKTARIRELELKGARVEGDAPWFIKDFNVLYRVANQFVQRMHDVDDEPAKHALAPLVSQLERLAPAFGVTEEIRRGQR